MQTRKEFGLGIALVLMLIGLGLAGCGGGGDGNENVAKSEASVIPAEPIVDLNKVRDREAPIPMQYTQDFRLQECTMVPEGNNRYFDILKPGFKHVSYKPDERFRKEYRVLKETKTMDLEGIGRFEAAIIEEREFMKGVLRQISLNWYAMCKETGSVFSVGEGSKHLNANQTVKDTEGSWQAGLVNGKGEVAVPAMQIPGTVAKGSRYIFDGAPGVALGGSEIVALGLKTVKGKLTTARTKYYKGESVRIPITKSVGELRGCIQIEEISQDSKTRAPDLGDVTNKVWCPNLGLVYDTSDGALIESNRKEMQ
jgi:hypothetical protein